MMNADKSRGQADQLSRNRPYFPRRPKQHIASPFISLHPFLSAFKFLAPNTEKDRLTHKPFERERNRRLIS